jgi:hypothetical protein
VRNRVDARVPNFSSCLFPHGLMLHGLSVFCNPLQKNVAQSIETH